MTHAVRLVNIDGAWTSEAERSQMEVDAGQEISDGTAKNAEQDARLAIIEAQKIGPPWKQDPTSHNLYPELVSGETPGVGTVDNPVAHVAIGHQGLEGSEGYVVERASADGGGLLLIGYAGLDPDNLPPAPVQGNTPIEVNGTAVLIATGGLWLELQAAINEDHEVILGQSTTLPDGRHFSPLLIGPEKVYAHQEDAEDTADHDVLDVGEVEIVSLTLANSYAAGVSTGSFSVMLDNPGNKSTVFDVILKVDGTEVGRYPRTLNGTTATVSDAFTLANPVNAGQVVSLDVEATSTHGNSQGWVRGTVSPTRIQLQQG